MSAIRLSDLRVCLDGMFPSVIATAAPDGTPNVSVISDARYLDAHHVALSYQFFNKTRANILANPKASLQVTDPNTGSRYHLAMRYLRTETSGPLFEAMKAKLAGIASHVGMGEVFRLRGADVYEVEDIECVVGDVAPRGAGEDLLAGLRAGLPLLRRAEDLEDLLDATLHALALHLGFHHCMILSADSARRRLFTVASHGYPQSGVGSEIAFGEGVIGVAAAERTPVRITHMARDYLYGEVVRRQFAAAHGVPDLERRIPFPGLAESRSQLAVPIVTGECLVGAIYVEGLEDGAITPLDEDACVVLAEQFADCYRCVMHLEAEDEEDEEPPTDWPAQGEPLLVRHDAHDHSVFVDGEYLIKGVAGAILWRILHEYEDTRRVLFTNRELRRDPRLGLPEIADNLEARLVLLQKRLDERRPGLRLQKAGRGRYQLQVLRPIEFDTAERPLDA
ncbi:MAG: GAF domain-containing protein [Gammaproteobacteria bacterium]|nr:GAF domain-containing protein [Gammaproteobacteria bacterium]MBI5618622.1 GAF domain-containing protein [Gammaproteobacteria bacterium]